MRLKKRCHFFVKIIIYRPWERSTSEILCIAEIEYFHLEHINTKPSTKAMWNWFWSYRPGFLIRVGDFRSLSSRFLSIFFVKFGRVLVIDRIGGLFRLGDLDPLDTSSDCRKHLSAWNFQNYNLFSIFRWKENVLESRLGDELFRLRGKAQNQSLNKSSDLETSLLWQT